MVKRCSTELDRKKCDSPISPDRQGWECEGWLVLEATSALVSPGHKNHTHAHQDLVRFSQSSPPTMLMLDAAISMKSTRTCYSLLMTCFMR